MAIRQAQDEKRKVQMSVPGIIGPHDMPDEEMQDWRLQERAVVAVGGCSYPAAGSRDCHWATCWPTYLVHTAARAREGLVSRGVTVWGLNQWDQLFPIDVFSLAETLLRHCKQAQAGTGQGRICMKAFVFKLLGLLQCEELVVSILITLWWKDRQFYGCLSSI